MAGWGFEGIGKMWRMYCCTANKIILSYSGVMCFSLLFKDCTAKVKCVMDCSLRPLFTHLCMDIMTYMGFVPLVKN